MFKRQINVFLLLLLALNVVAALMYCCAAVINISLLSGALFSGLKHSIVVSNNISYIEFFSTTYQISDPEYFSLGMAEFLFFVIFFNPELFYIYLILTMYFNIFVTMILIFIQNWTHMSNRLVYKIFTFELSLEKGT